jgi:hypothetical protein
MRNYSTTNQRQPLRVPRTWVGDDRQLVLQLEDVLNDIYARFGRLKVIVSATQPEGHGILWAKATGEAGAPLALHWIP